MDQENTTPEGLSRRDLLRRGAALGGALAWATPVVQVIGMSPALANVPSPPPPPNGECETIFRAKANVNGSWSFESSPGVGANDCATGCDGAPGVDGSNYLTISGDDTSVTICPKPGVEILQVESKGGQDVCRSGSGPNGSGCWTVSGDEPALSNVTICFCVETVE